MVSTRTWLMAGALATAMALPAVSSADHPPWAQGRDRRAYGSGRSMAFDAGFDRGFREGHDNGRKDARRHRSFDVYRDGDARDTDKGYDDDDGPKSVYRDGYRNGYVQGYQEGYGRMAYRGYRNDGYRYGRYGANSNRAPGWYDREGRWHRGTDDRRDGWYDRDGRWHDRDDDDDDDDDDVIIYEEPR